MLDAFAFQVEQGYAEHAALGFDRYDPSDIMSSRAHDNSRVARTKAIPLASLFSLRLLTWDGTSPAAERCQHTGMA